MSLMKSTISILLAAAAAIVPVAAKDSASTLSSLKVQDMNISRANDNLNVSFKLDFSGVNLGSNEQIIYTPMIVGEEEGQQVALTPIILNGRNAQIKWEREPKRHRENNGVIRRVNNSEQSIALDYGSHYEPWMDFCNIVIAEDLCGCGVLRDQDKLRVGLFDNTPAEPVIMTFIAPAVEAVKARAIEGSAYVEFVVAKTNILPDFRNNAAEIRRITKSIDLVKDDPTVEITEINIHGFASPEGTYALNTRLASGRAAALTEYVKAQYNLPADLFTTGYTPEDWAGLRRMVEAVDLATLPQKAELLEIIDSDLAPDAKDRKLETYYPNSYVIMLHEMYPALRRSDYKIKYVVRSFTVEETAEMMKINPGNVSLNEMFLVANTYEPGSPEFNEAMLIAVNTYPDDPTANLNAAAAAITAGDYAKAEQYLLKAGDTPEAIQARGVVAMNRGDLDTAERLLLQAKEAGVKDADHNLTVLARNRRLAKQNL